MNIKNKIIFFTLFIGMPLISFCENNQVYEEVDFSNVESKVSSKKSTNYDFFLGPAFAVFHSTDDLYKELHQQETFVPMLQFQVNFLKLFGIWSDLGFFYNEGYLYQDNLIFPDPKLKIYHLLFGVGLKLQYEFTNNANMFIKAGPSLIYVHSKQNFPLYPKTISKTGFGVTAGAGFQAQIKNNFYTTFFADYIYNEETIKHPTHPKKIELGGFLTGLGLQYKF